MTRQMELRHEFVDFIPENLEQGILYISRKYSTAAHLCCCGCGLEVVTPLNDAKWSVIEKEGTVSLYPSIGNWSFPCKSHYWITSGKVSWARELSYERIEAIKLRDQKAVASLAKEQSRVAKLQDWLGNLWQKLLKRIQNGLKIK